MDIAVKNTKQRCRTPERVPRSTGDAAHLWIPAAGYGMNAGIADAVPQRRGFRIW
jgi:hypothetical protein